MVAELPPKGHFSAQELTHILSTVSVNGVVTALSHANRDKSSNCDIFVTCVQARCFLSNDVWNRIGVVQFVSQEV